jgi:antitoxin (DNA-binding transcriptional repressor) of toxin-antitoxin stability system
MTTVTLQEAQATLPDLIHRLAPGDELLVTEDDRPVAKLVAASRPEAVARPRQLGILRGSVLTMEHFDDPLEDFEGYR